MMQNKWIVCSNKLHFSPDDEAHLTPPPFPGTVRLKASPATGLRFFIQMCLWVGWRVPELTAVSSETFKWSAGGCHVWETSPWRTKPSSCTPHGLSASARPSLHVGATWDQTSHLLISGNESFSIHRLNKLRSVISGCPGT